MDEQGCAHNQNIRTCKECLRDMRVKKACETAANRVRFRVSAKFDTSESRIMLGVFRQAVEDALLSSSLRSRVDALRYLNGPLDQLQHCGVDVEWARNEFARCGIPLHVPVALWPCWEHDKSPCDKCYVDDCGKDSACQAFYTWAKYGHYGKEDREPSEQWAKLANLT